MHVVAVEDGLGNIRDALEDAGFLVVGMEPEDLSRADAVVISGGDIDILQMENIEADVPVISAEGRSAEEVVDDVRERLELL
ncbi:MAG: YkuS family protein [Thermacetogeniaceae bacterium]